MRKYIPLIGCSYSSKTLMYTNGKYFVSQVDRSTVLVWYLQRWTLAAICGKSVFAHGRSKFSDSRLGLAECSKLHAVQPWTTYLFVCFRIVATVMQDFKLCIVVYMQPLLGKVFIQEIKWLFSTVMSYGCIFSNIQYICWNNVCVCWNRTEVLNSIFIMVQLNIL